MKKVLSIQDISCVGKCSLTVALPIISSMGIECAILPTSLLSNHTAFKSFTFLDLTNEMKKILNEFKNQGFEFDSIYSGYLGSKEQIDILIDVAKDFKNESNYVICDPAMADYGKLYPGFDMDFANHMFKLCLKADVILPNITEACLMLGLEYKEKMSKDDIELIMSEFAKTGVKNVVLTGVSFDDSKLGFAFLDEKRNIKYHFNDVINARYHGSGDIFASTFTGALMNGKDMFTSAVIASKFVCESLKLTLKDKNSNWYGLNFEQAIPYLLKDLQKY